MTCGICMGNTSNVCFLKVAELQTMIDLKLVNGSTEFYYHLIQQLYCNSRSQLSIMSWTTMINPSFRLALTINNNFELTLVYVPLCRFYVIYYSECCISCQYKMAIFVQLRIQRNQGHIKPMCDKNRGWLINYTALFGRSPLLRDNRADVLNVYFIILFSWPVGPILSTPISVIFYICNIAP